MNEQIASHRDKNKMQNTGLDMTVIEAITTLCPPPPLLSLRPRCEVALRTRRLGTSPRFLSHQCRLSPIALIFNITVVNHHHHYDYSNVITTTLTAVFHCGSRCLTGTIPTPAEQQIQNTATEKDSFSKKPVILKMYFLGLLVCSSKMN